MPNIIYGSTLREIAANLDFLGDYPNQYKIKYKPGQVYYIRLEFPFTTWYKVGYTSHPLMERLYGKWDKRKRMTIGGMGIPKSTKVKIIDTYQCANAYEAYRVEQALHNIHQKERSYGLNLLRNGNSELYKRDILGLDKTYLAAVQRSVSI